MVSSDAMNTPTTTAAASTGGCGEPMALGSADLRLRAVVSHAPLLPRIGFVRNKGAANTV
jgi:hypothetical protein